MDLITAIPFIGRFYKDTTEIIKEVVTDKDKQNELIYALDQNVQSYKHDEAMAEIQAHAGSQKNQVEINKLEAVHPSLFVSGWRPFVGWTCGTALFLKFIAHPVLDWILTLAHAIGIISVKVPAPPTVDVNDLYPLLLGLLGIGAMRTYDKLKGIDTKHIFNGGKNEYS